jgi:hypothetical protein
MKKRRDLPVQQPALPADGVFVPGPAGAEK